MSEEERVKLGNKSIEGIWEAQRKLDEREARLGEPVVIADEEGMPVEISGEEALRRFFGQETPGKD